MTKEEQYQELLVFIIQTLDREFNSKVQSTDNPIGLIRSKVDRLLNHNQTQYLFPTNPTICGVFFGLHLVALYLVVLHLVGRPLRGYYILCQCDKMSHPLRGYYIQQVAPFGGTTSSSATKCRTPLRGFSPTVTKTTATTLLTFGKQCSQSIFLFSITVK